MSSFPSPSLCYHWNIVIIGSVIVSHVTCTPIYREDFTEWTESEKAEKIVRVMDGLEGEVRGGAFQIDYVLQ